jgi:LytTr DNA-binding domain
MIKRIEKGVACLLTILLFLAPPAFANTLRDTSNVIICPTQTVNTPPPDFTSSTCFTTIASAIDPQQKVIWVKANINLEKTQGQNGEPLALFVLAKMASKVYLNGQFIGANGAPGLNAATETVGLMDAQFYPPQSLFRIGDNEVVFLASSHSGLLRLARPVHAISIAPSVSAQDIALRHYWPSLLLLGLFILGSLYFGVLTFISAHRRQALVLSLIFGFAAAQLTTEVLRGLVAYPYPVHDIRLVLIAVFSAGFGLMFLLHILLTFKGKYIAAHMVGTSIMSLFGVIFAGGYDTKSAIAMLLPLLMALTLTAYWTYRRQRRALRYFVSLLAFVAAVFIFPSLFLDVIFFYFVSALLFFLTVEQAFVSTKEAAKRRIEEARANKLELALELASERKSTSVMIVKGSGKIEHIAIDQISYCAGADGYSKITLQSGREVLHGATLAEIEQTLPKTFLRVHRSYLVNTAFVKALTRDPAGTGTLVLTNGSLVPVSRRTMPLVRQALI